MSDNIYGNTKIEQLLNPINATSTRTSSAIDTSGFHERLVLANIGFALDALSGSRYWTIKLQEGETTSAFSDVADSDTFNGAGTYVVDGGADDEQVYTFSYKGSKRFLRVTIISSGSHSVGTPMAVTAVLGKPAHAPVL